MSQLTQQPTGRSSRHPAYAALACATHALRARLARGLAIEYDWRYHDGPEWAARYWQAFGDLVGEGADTGASADVRRVLEREHWPRLSSAEATDVRTIFRSLIPLADPNVVPDAAEDARALLWPRIVAAYRAGDRRALIAAWSEVRALVRAPALPEGVVALRAEHDRLAAAAARTDRRLAEMSRRFPFNMRDKLADANWVHQQRRALSGVGSVDRAARSRIGVERVS